jgi:SAM-dependent methyltransferase
LQEASTSTCSDRTLLALYTTGSRLVRRAQDLALPEPETQVRLADELLWVAAQIMGLRGEFPLAYDEGMSESVRAASPKESLKVLSARLMRPGLASVQTRLTDLETRLNDGLHQLHVAIDKTAADRVKYDSELEYWRYLVKRGGARADFGDDFEIVFGRWTRLRLLKLGQFLGLPDEGNLGDIDDWCRDRSVVEIGAGPSPAVAAARRGWRRCVAVDPLARGYAEEGLVPASCQHVIYIEAPGERIPLAAGFADVVVCENCLDHVSDPAEVVREMRRLLAPGGYLWLFVDLSDHQDHMHPHPMNVEKLRRLLAGFETVREDISDHRAHPEAYGGYRVLCRRPPSDAATLPAHAAPAQQRPMRSPESPAESGDIDVKWPKSTHAE